MCCYVCNVTEINLHDSIFSGILIHEQGILLFNTGFMALGQYILTLTLTKDERNETTQRQFGVGVGTPPALSVRYIWLKLDITVHINSVG